MTPILTIPPSMRAIPHRVFGTPESLQLGLTPTPSPGPRQILIQVHAAAVNKGDWHVLTGKPYLIRLIGYGFSKPRYPILGQEVAGRVVAAGKQVTRFSPGDAVFGELKSGAFAEYALAPEHAVIPKPDSVPYDAAAATPSSGLTALQGLRDHAKLQPGQKILIHGASGGVGTFAVQLARFFGAEITAVCSTPNLDMVSALGAHHVIDYTQTDFTTSSQRYDVVFDTVGNRDLASLRRILRPRGIYVCCSGSGGAWLGPFPRMMKMGCLSKAGGQTFTSYVVDSNPSDLAFLAGRLEAGDLKPAITRRLRLEEVPEALSICGSDRAKGKMILRIRD